MVKSLVTGLCLAVFAAVIIGLSNLLGLDLEHVALLGAALGGVLGLVPHRPAWGKVAGFLAGFLLAWLGFALRAAVLPDSSAGRAVAAFVVVALIAVVAAVSRGRLPLWSGLVGCGLDRRRLRVRLHQRALAVPHRVAGGCHHGAPCGGPGLSRDEPACGTVGAARVCAAAIRPSTRGVPSAASAASADDSSSTTDLDDLVKGAAQ